MMNSDETCAWHALPVPLMSVDDPRQQRLIYSRIVRGVVVRWSIDLESWTTHWVLLPAAPPETRKFPPLEDIDVEVKPPDDVS